MCKYRINIKYMAVGSNLECKYIYSNSLLARVFYCFVS